jgi:hypothetical protein
MTTGACCKRKGWTVTKRTRRAAPHLRTRACPARSRGAVAGHPPMVPSLRCVPSCGWPRQPTGTPPSRFRRGLADPHAPAALPGARVALPRRDALYVEPWVLLRIGALTCVVRSCLATGDVNHACRAAANIDALITGLPALAPLRAALCHLNGECAHLKGDYAAAAACFAQAEPVRAMPRGFGVLRCACCRLRLAVT